MRAFTFTELGQEEFDAFSASHPQGNFQQTHLMGDVRLKSGLDVSYLGVRENGTLVAATALIVHRGRLSSFAEIHDGPLCDFHDAELTRFFFDNIKRTAKAAGAAQLSITPEAPYQIRDSFGKALPTESDAPWPDGVPKGMPAAPDTASFEAITSYGFVHEGFDTTYNAIPRWRYVKDLTGISNEQELLATYTKNTRRDIRIAQDSFVRVEQIGRDQLGDYHTLCELSSEKQGFDNRPIEYFQLLFDTLGDAAEFKVAYIDMPAYLASWEAKRDALAADIERLEATISGSDDEQGQFRSHRKAQRQLNDAREKYQSSLKRVESAQAAIEAQGERIPAAAALFVWHPRECVYLFSGSDQRHAPFCAATAIQHHMLCECVERGITRYNFYGINGIFDDPADSGRGLLEFKQGFNGYVEEMMGSFTLPVKPAAYALKQLAHKVLKR